MRKCILLLSTTLCFTSTVFSQTQVRLIGGPQQATIKETNSLQDWNTDYNPYYKKRTAFHLGINADIPLRPHQKLFVQPGIVFSSKGRIFEKYPDTTIDANFRIKSTTLVNYVELPVNMGIKLPLASKLKFVLTAGPYAGLFFGGKETTETTSKDFVTTTDETNYETGKGPDKFKSLDLGFNATAGFDFGGITLTARYTRSLINNFTASYAGTFKHEVIGATLGITLYTLRDKKPAPVIKDTDKDGFNDTVDECPTIYGKVKGCPDRDGDGVADKNDKCPNVPGLAKYNGCPVPDTDGDGLNDEVDKCPLIPGIAKYNGCPPPDTDKDGVIDEEDKCPDVPGLARYNGCPIPDTDGDGVNDEEDKCPTLAGLKENMGCPEIKTEVKKKVEEAAKKVFFDFGSNKIKTASLPILNEIAQILTSDPDLKLTIEGHTDSIGTAERNQIVSQERADAIKNYLISKNIKAERLTAIGYGYERPVADNKTAKGRAQNRRVEMILSY